MGHVANRFLKYLPCWYPVNKESLTSVTACGISFEMCDSVPEKSQILWEFLLVMYGT